MKAAGYTPLRNGHDQDFVPPHIELEQSLLAALLVDNRRLPDVGALQPEHFGFKVHARIFAVIKQLAADNLPATPETMTYVVAGDPGLAASTWDLKTLAQSVVSYTPHAVAHYARELMALHAQRELVALGNDLSRIFLDAKQPSYVDRVQAVRGEFDNIFRKWQREQSSITAIDYLRAEDDPQISRQWLVQNWLPMGETCGLGGVGGEGKTLLAHQLATVAALGCGEWLGMPASPMKAALLLCEDNVNDACWRQAKINRLYKCSMSDLHGELLTLPRREAASNYLAVFDKDNNMHLTEFFNQLLEELKSFGAKMVVLDTREDVFNGDQNNPIHARKFVRGCCDRIARELGGIVVLVYHPSVRGLSDGDMQSGSVQWNSSYRARLVLTRPAEGKEDDDTADTRVLSLIKGNFAPPSEAIKINWQDGAFVPKPKPIEDRITVNAETSKACRVFLQLLDAYNATSRFVSTSSRATNFAPKTFAEDAAREGCTQKQFDRAMSMLFARNQITNQPYGPPSRGLIRIARAER
jgi:RecA-family ATPase